MNKALKWILIISLALNAIGGLVLYDSQRSNTRLERNIRAIEERERALKGRIRNAIEQSAAIEETGQGIADGVDSLSRGTERIDILIERLDRGIRALETIYGMVEDSDPNSNDSRTSLGELD